MKPEEALKLNEMAFLVDANGNTDSVLIEANSMACVALSQMVPEKPVIKHTDAWIADTYYCPECDNELRRDRHCDRCRQAIKWED